MITFSQYHSVQLSLHSFALADYCKEQKCQVLNVKRIAEASRNIKPARQV